MSGTVFVTGADARYFSMACGLSQAFKLSCPGEKLYICDFGLTPGQRRFLEKQGVLLRAPEDLKKGTHPFIFKASLGRFIEPLDHDAVVWIDCDCLVMTPIHEAIAAMLESVGDADVLAVCENTGEGSIGEFLSRFDAEPFAALVAERGLSQHLPYFNSCVFCLRSRELLERWASMTREIKPHGVFEQNVFNVLAHSLPLKLLVLDHQIWNAHHTDLSRIELREPESQRLFLEDKPVAVVHATSSFPGFIEEREFSLRVESHSFSGFYKLFVNPVIRDYQQAAIEGFVVGHQEQLAECGLLQPA